MPLRPMTAADLDAVVAIERAAVAFPWSIGQFRASLQGGDYCTVLVERSQLLGFSLFSRVLDEATLLNIAVDPRRQGEGLGCQLLIQGLHTMALQGANVCFLEVRASNRAAQSLYYSQGFTVVGERKAYYPAAAGREDALVMSRPLP